MDMIVWTWTTVCGRIEAECQGKDGKTYACLIGTEWVICDHRERVTATVRDGSEQRSHHVCQLVQGF